MIIPFKLGQLRKRSGVTQQQAADHVDVTRKTICNWEQGKTKPNINQHLKLYQLYGVTPKELEEIFKRLWLFTWSCDRQVQAGNLLCPDHINPFV